MITIPEQAVYERFSASGMTSYSYEDICRAATAYNEAESQYQKAIQEAGEALVPYRNEKLIAWELYLEGAAEELVQILNKYNLSGVNTYGKNKEQWPVRKWEQATKQHQTATKKIRAATAKVKAA